MGDRANIVVKASKEQVCLYTHWSGSELPATLQGALKRGVDRWTDFQYLTRIIFSEMIKNDIMDTTGYGITQEVWDGGDNVIVVDVDNQSISLPSKNTYSFKDYIKIDLEGEDID